jgi:cullin 1
LIREHSEEMWGEFQRLLDYDKDEDLQRMYALLARIPEGLQPLRRQFEGYVKRAGHRAVSKLVTMGGGNAVLLEPKIYVDSLFEACRRHEDIVQRNFESERGFVAALEKGCRSFVDYNAVTGTDLTKSPELLAMSADAMLHKSSKLSEEGDLDDALSRLVRTVPCCDHEC